MKPLSSFIVLLRTPFYIKVLNLWSSNILNLSCCFFFTAAFRTTTITTTNFTSNNVSNKVYIMLTICTTFFSRQRKEKLRFWKLFGIKVSFLKSFLMYLSSTQDQAMLKLFIIEKIKTICISIEQKEICRWFVCKIFRFFALTQKCCIIVVTSDYLWL